MATVHSPWFAQYEAIYRPATAAIIRGGGGIPVDEVSAARHGRRALRAELEGAMADAGIDLWVCPPARRTAPPGIHATGNPIMNLPWTHAGLPALTVPAGFDADNLPYGLQCVAAFGADERLLAWAGPLADALHDA